MNENLKGFIFAFSWLFGISVYMMSCYASIALAGYSVSELGYNPYMITPAFFLYSAITGAAFIAFIDYLQRQYT